MPLLSHQPSLLLEDLRFVFHRLPMQTLRMNLLRKRILRRLRTESGKAILPQLIADFSRPLPRYGPKGSHGRKPGRAGSLLCPPCRSAKRGNKAPCVRNPHRRGVPCDPCKKKGFTAEKCGVRTKGPNGAEESFNTSYAVAVTSTFATDINRRVMQEYGIPSDSVPEPIRPQRQIEPQYAYSYLPNLTFRGDV